MLTGALCDHVDGVVAFAPSDVVWGGITKRGRVTSHWTHDGRVLPFVPFANDWHQASDPPAFIGLYERSRQRFPDQVAAATIPVERIAQLVLIAGGDDQVWPSVTQAEAIRHRRADHGLPTTVVIDPDAGHRTILPGEHTAPGGMRMQRGGNDTADRRLGREAWTDFFNLLSGMPGS